MMVLIAALLIVGSLAFTVARTLRVRPATESADVAMGFVLVVAGAESLPDHFEGVADLRNVEVVPVSSPPWLEAGRAAVHGAEATAGRAPAEVLIGVVRAEDQVPRDLFGAVARRFSDPEVGAVQVGLRASRDGKGLLRRLQEMELLAFTELVLSSGVAVGAPAYGPCGYFVRASALDAVDPQVRTTAEDVEVSVQLAAGGWRSGFCPGTGVVRKPSSLVTLVVERANALSGLLRATRYLPAASRNGGPAARTLVQPLAAVIAALAIPALALVVAVRGASGGIRDPGLLGWLAWYLLVFGPGWIVGYVAWLRRGRGTLIGSLILGHVFSIYSLYWLPATWLALLGLITGRGRVRRKEGVADPADEPRLDAEEVVR